MTPREIAAAFGHELLDAGPVRSPAISIAVAGRHGPVWSGAFGTCDLELGVPASTDHLFRLGSVSKVITAVAAARLAIRNEIDLDAPISCWIDDLPPQHRATTLKQLLTHRAGIRHYLPADLNPATPGGPIYARQYGSSAEILALFIGDPLVANPGERVCYSSFGYTLASAVMEAASGTEFTSLIAREIRDPFALPSLVPDNPLSIIPGRATGYMAEADRNMYLGSLPELARPALIGGYSRIPLVNPAYCWAGAGYLMTPSDCARFGASLLEGENALIGPLERDMLFTALTERQDASPPLGLGWRIDEDALGRLRWHHAGSTPGGRFGLVVYPAQGLSIALAGNTMLAPGDILGPSSRLADLFG